MNKLARVFSSVRNLALLCMVAACFCVGTPLMAQTSLSGDLGVDIAAWVPTVAAAFGTLIAAVLGVYFLVRVVIAGMSWIRRFAAR